MRRKVSKFSKCGPFTFFRVKEWPRNFLSVSVTGDDRPYGWEWGTDGESSGNPSFCIRLGYFNLFSFERYEGGGFIMFVLGFWWMKD